MAGHRPVVPVMGGYKGVGVGQFDGDIIYAIWTCMGYTVLLCFTLFKTSSMARSIFNAG